MTKSKSKKTVKSKKPEASIEDFQGYTQTVEEMLEETTSESPAVNEPRISDVDLAKQLTGSPVIFGENYQAALGRLVEQGIAADFGDEGYARGCKWRSKITR